MGKVWQISAFDVAIPESVRRDLGLGKNGLNQAELEAASMRIAPERLDEKTAKRVRVLRRAAECPAAMPLGEWYSRIAADENVSVPTIYRWLAERAKGKVVSDRAPISVAVAVDAGPLKVGVRSRTFAPQALEYGFSLLVRNPGMDVKRAYHEMAVESEKQGWEIGSLPTFYRKWGELPDAVRILSRTGAHGLQLLIKPAILRDLSCYRVYEVLVGDQHIFDYTVLDDTGQPIRPQMFAWADLRSRYFSGVWPVMGDYDQYAVGFALREACRWGIPESLYTDWGRPERSTYVASLRKQLSGFAVFKDIGDLGDAIMPHRKAKPRNAQAKPIESWFFHALESPLKQRNLPGYSRQDKLDEKRNEFIQKRLRDEIKGQKLLRAREFFEIVVETLDTWHQHAMVEEQIRPGSCFLEGISRSLIRLDDRTLDFLFWPSAIRHVRKSQVEMTLPGYGKCRWYAPELSALCGRTKERVEVRFNPYDSEVVHVLDLETHEYICTAEHWKKEDPHDMGVIAHKIRQQNELVKHWMSITKQLARPDAKVHRYTPYAAAAMKAVDARKAKEQSIVNDAEINKKIIRLAKDMGMELPAAQAL
jgi:hypothetical protein